MKFCPFRLATSYNVLDYGAKADGVTDDQPAVQAAVDACAAAGGGRVYLPAGTYYLYSGKVVNSDCFGHIALKDGVYLKGAGQTQTFLRGDRDSCSVIVASQKSDICVSDLDVDGPTTADGLKLYACSHVTVDHVTAHDSYTGISLAGCNDSTISNSIAYNQSNWGISANENAIALNNPDGLWCSNVTISDCEAYACAQRGFAASGRTHTDANPKDADSVSFIRCYAHDNTRTGFFHNNVSNLTMSDCVATGNNSYNVYLAGVHTAAITNVTYGGTGGAIARILHESSWTIPYNTDPTNWPKYLASTNVNLDGVIY